MVKKPLCSLAEGRDAAFSSPLEWSRTRLRTCQRGVWWHLLERGVVRQWLRYSIDIELLRRNNLSRTAEEGVQGRSSGLYVTPDHDHEAAVRFRIGRLI